MSSRLDLPFDLKAISASQRLIEGYAATTSVEDSVGDVIDPGAFRDALGGRSPADIPVFIGHQHSDLPVGIPLEIREDGHGLFTRTRIHQTQAGDDLLAVARERQAAGNPLGMSIGYHVNDYALDRGPSGSRRRIKSLTLGEYSFTVMPANAAAYVTAVKSAPPLSDAELALMSLEMAMLGELAAREKTKLMGLGLWW